MSDKLEVIKSKALDIIGEALDNVGTIDQRTQLAMKMLNHAAKVEQSHTAKTGLKYHMLQRVGTDDEIKEYIRSTQPEIKKLLGPS